MDCVLNHQSFIEEWSEKDCGESWSELSKEQQQQKCINKVKNCLYMALTKNINAMDHLYRWEPFKKEIIEDERIMALYCQFYGIQNYDSTLVARSMRKLL